MTSYGKLAPLIGQRTMMRTDIDTLTMYVEIIDVRDVFGRVDVRVRPVRVRPSAEACGSGAAWVSLDRTGLERPQ